MHWSPRKVTNIIASLYQIACTHFRSAKMHFHFWSASISEGALRFLGLPSHYWVHCDFWARWPQFWHWISSEFFCPPTAVWNCIKSMRILLNKIKLSKDISTFHWGLSGTPKNISIDASELYILLLNWLQRNEFVKNIPTQSWWTLQSCSCMRALKSHIMFLVSPHSGVFIGL